MNNIAQHLIKLIKTRKNQKIIYKQSNKPLIEVSVGHYKPKEYKYTELYGISQRELQDKHSNHDACSFGIEDEY